MAILEGIKLLKDYLKYKDEISEQPIVVSRLLGHASIQITMDIYEHVIPDFVEQELEKREELYQ